MTSTAPAEADRQQDHSLWRGSWRKAVVPLLILLACILIARGFLNNRPTPELRAERARLPAVEAMRVQLQDYPVFVRSQGTVQPTTATTLVPEVAGSVTGLSRQFVVGGRFEQGEVLVQLERRDYTIALTGARAGLAQSQAQLAEEQALAQRAREDWASLGRGGAPSALTLREPQLAAAQANLDAARAEVERARLDLARTRIVAPYAGRVLEKSVDQGQFVNRGATIGRIHSLQSVDIPLPLGSRQLTWLSLPEAHEPADPQQAEPRVSADVQTDGRAPADRGVADPVALDAAAAGRRAAVQGRIGETHVPGTVLVSARIGGREHRWQGNLVRVEGLDAATQQLTAVARVENPWSQGTAPLRVGQFVQARLAGDVLEDVAVVPRSAIRDSDEVLVLDDQDRVFRRAVEIAWMDDEQVAISGGLTADELLVLTPMRTVTDGTPVRASIDGRAPPAESATLENRQQVGGS